MSDFEARRSFDDATVRAALVFPDDPVPSVGHDAVRIPVKVVWLPRDPITPEAEGYGSPASFPDGTSAARTAGNSGADDPVPDTAVEPEAERSQTGNASVADPLAKFLKVNEALERITGPSAPQVMGAAARESGDEDVPDLTAPVPGVDDNCVPEKRVRGAMMRPAGQSKDPRQQG